MPGTISVSMLNLGSFNPCFQFWEGLVQCKHPGKHSILAEGLRKSKRDPKRSLELFEAGGHFPGWGLSNASPRCE